MKLLILLLTIRLVTSSDRCFDMGNYWCYNRQCLSSELSADSYNCRGSGHNIPARCPENAICTNNRYVCKPGYKSVWKNPGGWGNFCNNCKLDHSCVATETTTPTNFPTSIPTQIPTTRPTSNPTNIPTQEPTTQQIITHPTLSPTSIEVSSPTQDEEKESNYSFFNTYIIVIFILLFLIIIVIYRLISQCIDKCKHENTLPITTVANTPSPPPPPPPITNVHVYQGPNIPSHLPEVHAQEIVPSAPPMMDKV
jgi:hypothetical protein